MVAFGVRFRPFPRLLKKYPPAIMLMGRSPSRMYGVAIFRFPCTISLPVTFYVPVHHYPFRWLHPSTGHRYASTLHSVGESGPSKGPDNNLAKEVDTEPESGGRDHRTVIKRLGTIDFHQFRKVEAEAGRVGVVAAGSWSKMAIVRIKRKTSKARCSTIFVYCTTNQEGHTPQRIANLKLAQVASNAAGFNFERIALHQENDFHACPPKLCTLCMATLTTFRRRVGCEGMR